MKYELTIDTMYVPDWGIWEGVREIVQNALDGHDDGHEMQIETGGGYVSFTNKGLKLPNSILLSGMTTKSYRTDQRGQWGEGLKLGLLALVRKGIDVVIYNGKEKWTPTLEDSAIFCDDGGKAKRVLVIKTRKMVKNVYDFMVKIKISEVQWGSFKKRFLHFWGDDLDVLDAHHVGKILINPELRGNIFCKGIWVCNRSDYDFGYDIQNLQIDRDRRVPQEYSLKNQSSNIWSQCLRGAEYNIKSNDSDSLSYKRGMDTIKRAYELANEGRMEVDQLGFHVKYDCHSVSALIAQEFQFRFGENAVPVTCAAEKTEIEYFGKNGIEVDNQLHDLLKLHYGDFEDMKRKIAESKIKVIEKADLDDHSLCNLCQSAILISTIADIDLCELMQIVEVVRFQSEDTLGSFDYVNGYPRIRISKIALNTFRNALKVFIHEFAHNFGADHKVSHVAAMQEIWSKVAELLLFNDAIKDVLVRDVSRLKASIMN